VADLRNDPDIHLELLSRPELLAPLRAMVNSMAAQAGLEDISACHLVLAMDEAITNIIRHGYDGSPDGRIWVTLSHLSDGPGLRVEISDRARTVDPQRLQGRDLADVRPGGLGLHLIRTLVDRFEHAPRIGGGMRIVLEKRPAPAIAGVA
jgi:anti-sigma regulatory factor (Ser/Thr protein kinase)